MTTKDSEAAPVHGSAHDALLIFLGEWLPLNDLVTTRVSFMKIN